ncbi:MAG TPA: hypothetical protein HPP87_03785 [Planctomycetes bacterium]|nr:hypothetical protein [Planctomycetota bacterium]
MFRFFLTIDQIEGFSIGPIIMCEKYCTLSIVERYEYAPFGQVQIMSSDFEIRDSSLYNNPYMFTGRRFDDETQLYYYRARM